MEDFVSFEIAKKIKDKGFSCNPYENNEHLLGTINDCDEYYKNW